MRMDLEYTTKLAKRTNNIKKSLKNLKLFKTSTTITKDTLLKESVKASKIQPTIVNNITSAPLNKTAQRCLKNNHIAAKLIRS